MKRRIALLLCFVLVLSLAGCGKGDVSKVEIDYGTSSVYTAEDMKAAIKVIKKKFRTWEGCELHRLSYSSDAYCNTAETVAWMNELEKANDNQEVFTQCIAFNSSFRSPKQGGGAWAEDQEYTWSWWLARREGGKWKLMSWGY